MRTLSTTDLQDLIQNEKPFLLVNVLPAKMFPETELPGSVNVPLEDPDFASRIEQLAGGKSNPVITYCANEDCPASEEAAEALELAGFRDVADYSAGAAGWRAEADAAAPSRR
ncbi:MAG: rhodanese-like domain-containing protein [Planctomyces sp.]|nr:rhodanese-like domain-containing protein [Planctomyces sp.]